MAFLLGLIGTVILVVLVGTIGFAVVVGVLTYAMFFVGGLLLLLSARLILEGFSEDNYGMGFGGIALLLLVVGLVVQLYRLGKKNSTGKNT